MDTFRQLFFWILGLDRSWVLKPSHDMPDLTVPIDGQQQILFLLTKELEYYENGRFIGHLQAPHQWMQKGVFMQILRGISSNPQTTNNAAENFDKVYIIELPQYYSLTSLYDVILNTASNQNFNVTSQHIKNHHIFRIIAK